jgi:hypothetical protein
MIYTTYISQNDKNHLIIPTFSDTHSDLITYFHNQQMSKLLVVNRVLYTLL